MKKSKKAAKAKNRNKNFMTNGPIKSIVLGVLPAIIFTVAAILIFALLIKAVGISDKAIPPTNQIIKIAGILIASFLTSKKIEKLSWLYGGISGMIYILLGYLVFSLIDGSFSLSIVILSDIGMGFIIGVIISFLTYFLPKPKTN